MADRYRVGSGGERYLQANRSTSDGGAGGASVPNAFDNVYFTSSSGNCSMTQNLAYECNDFDCTGYTGTISGNKHFIPHGNITFSAGMTWSNTGNIAPGPVGKCTLTSNGKTIKQLGYGPGGGLLELQDDLTLDAAQPYLGKAIDTKGYTINCINGSVMIGNLWLNDSIINVTAGSFTTVTPLVEGTSNIIYTATGTFNNRYRLYDVELNGATVGLNYSGAYNTLTLNGVGAQTITVTAGKTLVVEDFVATGTLGNLKTLTGSGTRTISKDSGTVVCDYLHLTNSEATGGATFYAGANSTDNGGNTGWIFTDPPAPSGHHFRGHGRQGFGKK